VESLTDLIEAHAEARERETWDVLMGRRARFDAEGIESRFELLASGDALEAARAEHEAATSAELRSARERMCFALEDIVLAARARVLAEAVAQREAAGAAQDELAERREEHFARLSDVRAELGYATGRARAEARHPAVDWDAWGRDAERFLQHTEPLYRDAVPPLARRARVGPRTRADLERIEAMPQFDALFSAARREPCLEYTLDGMGAALGSLRGVALDSAPPGSAGRPACVAPLRPGNVRLVVRAPAGAAVYRGYFEAAGRALHAAFTSSSLPVERRRLGDPALFAAFGELLRQIASDPTWLADFPAGRAADELAQTARFERLARLRRACARVGPALALSALGSGSSPLKLTDAYAAALRAATGVEHAPPELLATTDSELGAVHTLRALCLANQLAELLRRRCGRRFWRERAAGALLKEIWNTGSSYTAEDLASELGLGPLGVDGLIDDTVRAG